MQSKLFRENIDWRQFTSEKLAGYIKPVVSALFRHTFVEVKKVMLMLKSNQKAAAYHH